MSSSATQDLCGCLRRIAARLEEGDPAEAAAVVAEMNEVFPRLPNEMPDEELDEATRLLVRCKELEQGLRQNALTSLQRLAATRKSMIYRRYAPRP